MNHVTAALLDLANIVGGFLLAAGLLADLPRIGPSIARFATRAVRATTIVGVLALVMGGYYLILHLASGPHMFHFELIGIGVGIALLRERLFRRAAAGTATANRTVTGGLTGGHLLLAVFGLIAVVVGIQGLFTPDG